MTTEAAREAEAARLRDVFKRAGVTGSRHPSTRPRRMTTAKARRLIDALAVVVECEDLEASDRIAFEDARAAIDRYDGSR